MKKSIYLVMVSALALTSMAAIAQTTSKPPQTKPAVKQKGHKSNWLSRMFTAPHKHSTPKKKPIAK